MEATRSRHGWVHTFITHRPTLTLQLHNFDLFRTCRTSSFCTVGWQLARFQLTRRIARSLGDSGAFCRPTIHCVFICPRRCILRGMSTNLKDTRNVYASNWQTRQCTRLPMQAPPREFTISQAEAASGRTSAMLSSRVPISDRAALYAATFYSHATLIKMTKTL